MGRTRLATGGKPKPDQCSAPVSRLAQCALDGNLGVCLLDAVAAGARLRSPMFLLAIAVAVTAVLAGDEWASRRGHLGHVVTDVATKATGVIIVGALGYGLAAEGRRLAGAAKSAAVGRISGE